jgi:hypothetical protein
MENGLSNNHVPLTVGWKEYIDFPEWNLHRIKAKVDTGARTSALDVTSYDLTEAGGVITARLRLALNRKKPEELTVVETPVLEMVVVTSSTGTREQRPVVETVAKLGSVKKRIRLTITNRAGMIFRMILGRTALEDDFVVDVGKKYLLGRKRRKAGG